MKFGKGNHGFKTPVW